MRSGTSFFNGPLFRKNTARFWPVWVSYTVLWIFVLPLQFLTLPGRYSDSERLAEQLANQAEYVVRTLSDGVWISAIFGVVAAMAVFSYLFASRSAYMMHSMPMDRNTLFLTNYLSGLSFLVLPNVVIFLLTLAVEVMYSCVNLHCLLTWLVVQSATGLFFYSFAVFCAMFTGNLLALPAFYGILSFLVMVIDTLLSEVLSLLLYGFQGSTSAGIQSAVLWLTPMLNLYQACDTAMIRIGDVWVRGTDLAAPEVVAIYAVVALGLTVAALMVYHRRHVESAGDVVAIPIVRPLFKYGVALCAGLCFGVWTAAILAVELELTLMIFMALWAVVGYFVAEMLLQKSFRVFKRWKGAVVLGALLSLLCVSLTMDWFGFESRIPAADEIESIRIHSMNMGAPYDSASAAGLEITDSGHTQMLLDLHQAIIDHRPDNKSDEGTGDDYIYYTVEYRLKDGSVMQRRYSSVPVNEDEVTVPGTVAYAATQLFHDRDFVAQTYGFDQFRDMNLVSVYVQGLWNQTHQYFDDERMVDATSADLQRLWQAVCADFSAGRIGVRYLFDYSAERRNNTYTADLYFRWEAPGTNYYGEQTHVTSDGMVYTTQTVSSRGLGVTLTPQAEQTLSVLEELGTIRREELHTWAVQREMEGY